MQYAKPTKNETEKSNSGTLTPDEIKEFLRPITDPDIGVSIVDLGLIYKIENNNGDVSVDMTFTTPACPYGPQLLEEVRYTVNSLDSINSVNVEVVWDPPWSMENISEETRLEMGLDI